MLPLPPRLIPSPRSTGTRQQPWARQLILLRSPFPYTGKREENNEHEHDELRMGEDLTEANYADEGNEHDRDWEEQGFTHFLEPGDISPPPLVHNQDTIALPIGVPRSAPDRIAGWWHAQPWTIWVPGLYIVHRPLHAYSGRPSNRMNRKEHHG